MNKMISRNFMQNFKGIKSPLGVFKRRFSSGISPCIRLFDVAANMMSPEYSGIYRGKSAHSCDWQAVINRGRENGVRKFLFTAGTLKDAEKALELAKDHKDFFVTVGVHPCRAAEVAEMPENEDKIDNYFEEMKKLLREEESKGKVVAIGECGLDYDRLEYASKD